MGLSGVRAVQAFWEGFWSVLGLVGSGYVIRLVAWKRRSGCCVSADAYTYTWTALPALPPGPKLPRKLLSQLRRTQTQELLAASVLSWGRLLV